VPKYVYEAVNLQGRKLRGQHQAPTKEEAIRELQSKGLNIRSVIEKQLGLLEKEISIGNPVKMKDFVSFCRQFATLIHSGIQIMPALDILEEQTQSKPLRKALIDIHDQINQGNPLTQSLERHQKIFPDMFVNMVSSGEASGNLAEVLERMADHYEKVNKTHQKIISALTYPALVLTVAIGVVIFMMIKIIPIFTKMFEKQEQELPLITKFVILVSDMIVQLWWLYIPCFIGLLFALYAFMKSKKGRYTIDYLTFKIPIFGEVLRKAAIARFTRTLSSLFHSGLPMIESLHITKRVVGNQLMVRVIQETIESLEKGCPLSEPLSNNKLFPKLVTQMIVIGEESGQLDKMLVKIAETYDSDVAEMLDRLKSVIEPLLMLIVACFVGVIVAAIMTPMFQMYQGYLK
jgi:type IV pilus assembly protein PilC